MTSSTKTVELAVETRENVQQKPNRRLLEFEAALKLTSSSFCRVQDFNTFVFLSKWINITESQNESISSDNQACYHLFLGHWYLLLFDYRRSYLAYRRALHFDKNDMLKDNPDFLYGLGVSAGYLKFYHRAVKAFLRLVFLYPDYHRAPDARLRLALILKQLKFYERSRKFFRQVCYDVNVDLGSSVPLPEILLSYGHLLELKKDFALAKVVYDHLLNNDNTPILWIVRMQIF
ncbi:hypothetical protein ACOME3_007502 [Neoechinorhynchus agilis]